MLVGDLLANTGLAVAEYAKGNGVPYFIPIIAADDLTQRKRIPNVIRIAGYSASQMPRPLADYAYHKKDYRKLVTISQDYTFGYEQCGGFCQTFTELGGSVVQQFWQPLNTADFSPYLAQIQSLNPDVVYAMETGADANRLIQQYANFGLKGKIPMLGAMNLTDQSVIRTLGPECEGIISSAQFCEGSDAPATKKFVAEYEKAFNKLPSLYGFSMYSGAMWMAAGMTAVNGNVEDRPKFLDAIRKVVLNDSPLGRPVRLDMLRQSDLRRVYPASEAASRRQVLERAARDVSQRLAVLEIRSRDLHETTVVHPHVSRHQEILSVKVARGSRGQSCADR